jgi:hypothetical protein
MHRSNEFLILFHPLSTLTVYRHDYLIAAFWGERGLGFRMCLFRIVEAPLICRWPHRRRFCAAVSVGVTVFYSWIQIF